MLENTSDLPTDAPFTQVEDGSIPDLRVHLLGGFRIERANVPIADSAWQMRRTARALVKLLACVPGRSLHRDQVLEMLWPTADLESAAHGFSKALHAARRALEPMLPARSQSSYLQFKNDVLTLNTEHVWIDVDHFQSTAREALRHDEISAFKEALAAYPGELLPEDRYEPWVEERSAALTCLIVQILLAGADALQRHGAYGEAVEWLRRALQYDNTREDIHRAIMRVSVQMGSRHDALHQYRECREILMRELEVEPEPETQELYEDIRANRVEKLPPIAASDPHLSTVPPLLRVWWSSTTPLIGRDRAVEQLQAEMVRAEGGNGGLLFVSGETGVGKTRVVAEFAKRAARRGVSVLWGAGGAECSLTPCGAFVEALEGYLAGCPMEERERFASHYPDMLGLLPSLALGADKTRTAGSVTFDPTRLFHTIVRILTDLARTRPLLLVVSDLDAADAVSVQLLAYLARLAVQRRWLVVAIHRDDDTPADGEFARLVNATATMRVGRTIELRCLSRSDCDVLVGALLPAGIPDGPLLEYIYAHSLGNPLFVEELVKWMQERGELTLSKRRWSIAAPPTSVPKRIRNLAEDRVRHLGERAQRVLSLACMADVEFSLQTLRNAVAALEPSLDDASLLDALDEVLDARLLEEHEDRYAFTLPLFRAALRERLSKARREQLLAAVTLSGPDRTPRHNENVRGQMSGRGGILSVVRSSDLRHDLSAIEQASAFGEMVDHFTRNDYSVRVRAYTGRPSESA